MLKRSVLCHLKTLISPPNCHFYNPAFALAPRLTTSRPSHSYSYSYSYSFSAPPRHFSTDSDTSKPKKVEDVMPIATGHEREELEAELEGRDILEINHPEGPFGTKEIPAVVRSYYDRRIVGCPGGVGEDEHDVVWFWLEKDKPYECPVCTQYFTLEVVGPGGDPEGHDHEDGEHHY